MNAIVSASFLTALPESFTHPTVEKIQSFLDFENGWSHGEGQIFEETKIALAKKIHKELIANLFTETDAFPGLAGEVRVTAYKDNYYLEFTVEEDNSITFYFEKEDIKKERLEGLSFPQAVEHLEFIRDYICNISASFQSSTTMPQKEDFKALRSKIHQRLTEVESQSLTLNVLTRLAGHLVNTSGTTTGVFTQTQQFFGSSPKAFYLVTKDL